MLESFGWVLKHSADISSDALVYFWLTSEAGAGTGGQVAHRPRKELLRQQPGL